VGLQRHFENGDVSVRKERVKTRLVSRVDALIPVLSNGKKVGVRGLRVGCGRPFRLGFVFGDRLGSGLGSGLDGGLWLGVGFAFGLGPGSRWGLELGFCLALLLGP